MPENRSRTTNFNHIVIYLLLVAVLVSSCSPIKELYNFSPTPAAKSESEASLIEINRAEITFEVTVPETNSLQVYLDIVDEVAGIPWNPLRLLMEKKDNNTYSLSIPITVGSNIKYRYILGSNPALIEHNSRGVPVRYRMIYVSDPTIIMDTVIGWETLPGDLEVGRVFGKVVDYESGEPIPDILVTLAGLQTFSAVDGSFILEYVPVGTHQLVAYSTSGQYKTFQQGALISHNTTTQTDFSLSSTKFVDITFIVSPPTNHPAEAPIRIIGNTYAFGNTFANLNGGLSTIASRAPVMQTHEEGQYILTASLPAGMDLRYTYSLGDGFWNSEITPEGRFRVRQLIIPEQDATIEDQIISWGTDQSKNFSFFLKVPDNTPAGDIISIQFSPFGWTEPIPLWPLGDNSWIYQLYSPLQIGDKLEYRYCRNEQCDAAHENIGSNEKHSHSLRGITTEEINDQVESWINWSTSDQPTAIAAVDIKPRNTGFITGIEFVSDYYPTWQTYYRNSFEHIKDIGGNQVILTPTWTYTSNTPPVLEPMPGSDMLTADLRQAIFKAKEKDLGTTLFPQVHFPDSETDWWNAAPKNEEWWNNWFDRYSRYLIHFAEIAEKNGVSSLIIGEPGSRPSWPGGMSLESSEISAPPDAQERWLLLINNVRDKFSGQLLWAVPYPDGLKTDPALLSQIDAIYLVWEASVSDSNAPTQAELANSFAKLLSKKVRPFYESINKPIWIGLTYSSVDGAAQGCVKDSKSCVPIKEFFNDESHNSNEFLDLQEQADIYNAAFTAINEQEWIAGVTSRGFYPPASLKDNSYSVHGKPASDVIWYWFPRFSGIIR